jgi:hypothetical protein
MSFPLLRRARVATRSLIRPFIVIALATSPWSTSLITPAAAARPFNNNAHDPALPADEPLAGLHFGGLRHSADTDRCGGALEVTLQHGFACTHGPDRAPDGVDARVRPSTHDLREQLRVHQLAGADQTTAAATTAGSVYCYGDGTTGKRVEAIYAHAAGVTSRYASMLASFRAYAANADGIYNNSAAETSGVRHLRFVTDSACNLIVHDVTLSATGDDSISNTMSELASQGYKSTDRHYLVWVESNVYCGIGSMWNDDRADPALNYNAKGSNYARVDSGCWGGSVESHELMHNLGGVQKSAPHSSGAGHCYDETDRMCYRDTGPYFTNGGTIQSVCSSHESLFDCNHDDYYSTAPAAGSYLATHWNVANNPFLATAAGSTTGPPPSTTTTAPPTTSTTAPPTTTTTRPATTSTTVSGTASSTPWSYSLATGTGVLSTTTTWSGGFLIFAAPNLTVTVYDSSGRVLATKTGASPLALSASVVRGTNRISVTSPSSTTFTMKVTYPTP